MIVEICINICVCFRKWFIISLFILDGLGGGLIFVVFLDESFRFDYRCEILVFVYIDKKNILVIVKVKWIIILRV